MSQHINKSSNPEILKGFDFLPDDANVRQSVVEALFDCSGSSINRLEKSGKLKATKLSNGIKIFNVGHLRTVARG